MKLLGLIYMAGGCTLSILLLRASHGVWKDFLKAALFAAIPNVVTVLLAFLFFHERKWKEAAMDRVLLVACYSVGIGAGAYFYFT